MSETDWELISRYVRDHADDAFAAIVERHVDLVYSAALRQVRTPQLADEVAQSTFIDLARSAAELAPDTILSAWLYRVASRTAVDVIRRESRRQRREQIAHDLAAMNAPPTDWGHIEPLLDEAMNALGESERTSLLLRYFENQSLRDVGRALGISEDAAQKRVTRALERLRLLFAGKGCSIGASGIAGAIAANAIHAAPAGLSTAVATAAVAGSALAAATVMMVTKTIAMTTLQKTLITGILSIAVGTGIYQARQASHLRDELAQLQQLQANPQPNTTALAPASSAIANPTNAPAQSFDWRRVESGDYRQYLANLRSIGCPEETIRDIIRADVNQLYEEKKKQVRKSAPKWDYWTNPQTFIRDPGREMWMTLFELEEERDGVLRALGIEPDQRKRVAQRLNALDLLLEFLDDDQKKAQIVTLHNDLEDRLAVRDPNSLDLAGIAQLHQERDDSVKQLLTPEEARQYDLRMSSTARLLVHKLEAFEPSKSEFDAIFDLQKEVDDEFPGTFVFGIPYAQESTRMAEAIGELQDQIRQTLGPERFAEYQMAQDFAYQQIYRVAREVGLGIPAAREIYSLRQHAERQMAEIRLAPHLAPDEQTRLLENIRTASAQSIEALISDAGRAQLEQTRNGRWLETLLSLPVQPGAGPP